ncbi:hypothetical protein DVB88_03760 [Tsukamurella pulmonis]|nr:hypothetical protein DVB88_03760 [Tsukamurella pulmonis]
MVPSELAVTVPCSSPAFATACAATGSPTITTFSSGTGTPSVCHAPGFAVNSSPATGEKATELSC